MNNIRDFELLAQVYEKNRFSTFLGIVVLIFLTFSSLQTSPCLLKISSVVKFNKHRKQQCFLPSYFVWSYNKALTLLTTENCQVSSVMVIIR